MRAEEASLNDRGFGWGLVAFWIIATIVAAQISYNIPAGWIIMGGAIGIGQGLSLLLWKNGPMPILWLIATSVGWAIGFVITWAIGWILGNVGIGNGSDSISGLLISAVIGGPVLGVSQWLVLRRWVRGSAWWILATSIGYGFGLFLFIIAVMPKLGLYSPYLGTVVGLVYGAVTGLTLKLLSDWTNCRQRFSTLLYSTLILLSALGVASSSLFLDVTRSPFKPSPNINNIPLYPNARNTEVFQRRDASYALTTQWVKSFETDDISETVLAFYRKAMIDQGWYQNGVSSNEVEFTWTNGVGGQGERVGLTVRITQTSLGKTYVELLLKEG